MNELEPGPVPSGARHGANRDRLKSYNELAGAPYRARTPADLQNRGRPPNPAPVQHRQHHLPVPLECAERSGGQEVDVICLHGWFSSAKASPRIPPNQDYKLRRKTIGSRSSISSLRINVFTPETDARRPFNTHRLRSGTEGTQCAPLAGDGAGASQAPIGSSGTIDNTQC